MIVGARRLDQPWTTFDAGRELARGDPRAQRLEETVVEPEALEHRGGLAIDVDHDPPARAGVGSEVAYGARWTPSSVTIAVTSAAGVTSNAGLRAGKRAVTSAGSRSSIGMSAPVAALEVERGGRRDDVERDA